MVVISRKYNEGLFNIIIWKNWESKCDVRGNGFS